ncbi:hypothetical protein AGOR_G00123300 [Albula goreensis]|uniref:Uncharacterized protein n=1 Tax=Albula goreensis TaxID=1534307 RepID=A0A8T3DAV7_9TELE|nr:hypothetical protein AGOR_G00123300 [Albula goreensis]
MTGYLRNIKKAVHLRCLGASTGAQVSALQFSKLASRNHCKITIVSRLHRISHRGEVARTASAATASQCSHTNQGLLKQRCQPTQRPNFGKTGALQFGSLNPLSDTQRDI